MKKLLLIIALVSSILGPALHAQTSYTTIVSNDTPILYWNFDEASGKPHGGCLSAYMGIPVLNSKH